MPVYAALGLDLPEAERAASEVLSLPIWPALDSARIERVVTALTAALS
jgi:dTDP-4-amino-4,6-dideoxygalactose transaminase